MVSDQNGASSRSDSPEFTIDYDESRPYIQEYQKPPKFSTGEKVWYRQTRDSSLEGPFVVASVSSEGKYLLACDDPDKPETAKDGMEIDEEHLQSVEA
ncbi:hypothetical protein NCS57_00860100 [Fusarium keratoplasticum]|uniref:Uncharacterized protein n=1 Tax=Fusarium keratoplasticum TaxID=1328300 RepID=A0ACC0QWJ5_9HYPO|nr:hypothetical protein NCS57_00860100 [Fusarium keratoplasticum]KAI8666356.1 hypothetical protein NCS57_00860100 [Fusarium keratoplasticum]KAI8668056.1 hypothetical protein NCS55_00829700 [Fusarium keratoplasticum]